MSIVVLSTCSVPSLTWQQHFNKGDKRGCGCFFHQTTYLTDSILDRLWRYTALTWPTAVSYLEKNVVSRESDKSFSPEGCDPTSPIVEIATIYQFRNKQRFFRVFRHELSEKTRRLPEFQCFVFRGISQVSPWYGIWLTWAQRQCAVHGELSGLRKNFCTRPIYLFFTEIT